MSTIVPGVAALLLTFVALFDWRYLAWVRLLLALSNLLMRHPLRLACRLGLALPRVLLSLMRGLLLMTRAASFLDDDFVALGIALIPRRLVLRCRVLTLKRRNLILKL